MTLFRRLQRTAGSGRPNMSWCWETPIRCHPTARSSELTEAPELQLTAHAEEKLKVTNSQFRAPPAENVNYKLYRVTKCYSLRKQGSTFL